MARQADRDSGRVRRRQKFEQAGRRAETIAALWLQLKGYRILDRRARTPVGEIDLVARKGRMLVFTEVKARTTRETAQLAVTPQLRRRIEQAARLWCSRRRDCSNLNWRFDVIAIAPRRPPLHLRDAWRAEE